MNKISYLIYCLRHMDYRSAWRAVGETAKAARRPRIWILGDMVYCGLRYQAGYNDYRSLDFYCLNRAQRESILTRGKNNAIIRRYNDWDQRVRLDDKARFCALYAPFVRRRWLDLREADAEKLRDFAAEHPVFMAKPVEGIGGQGLERVETGADTDFAGLLDRLRREGRTLAEEQVVQHPALAELYPGAVNTLRLYTFLDGQGQAHLVRSVLKLGNHGSVVDNDAQGGMYTFLDENGVVQYPAADNDENIYERHPETGAQIPGFQVPFWQESADMVREAALVTPGVRYVGWDVAVTREGPVLIEGNSYPGVYDPKGRFWGKEILGCLSEYRKYMEI